MAITLLRHPSSSCFHEASGPSDWRPGHQTCPIDAGRSGAHETLLPQGEDQQGIRALRHRDPNDTQPLHNHDML